MKTLKRVFALSKRRLSRKAKAEEQLLCTETSCADVKTPRGGKLSQANPARDNCFNITNCQL